MTLMKNLAAFIREVKADLTIEDPTMDEDRSDIGNQSNTIGDDPEPQSLRVVSFTGNGLPPAHVDPKVRIQKEIATKRTRLEALQGMLTKAKDVTRRTVVQQHIAKLQAEIQALMKRMSGIKPTSFKQEFKTGLQKKVAASFRTTGMVQASLCLVQANNVIRRATALLNSLK